MLTKVCQVQPKYTYTDIELDKGSYETADGLANF
jgi:hypothetical protein